MDPRRIDRIQFRSLRPGFVALLLAGGLAACGGSTPPDVTSSAAAATAAAATAEATAEATSTPEPTPEPTVTPEPTPEAQTTPLSAALYFMGIEVNPSQVSYDPATRELRIDATFKNTGLGAQNLLYMTNGGLTSVIWDQQVTNLGVDSATSTEMPGGATIRGTLTGTMPEGFMLDDAVLAMGLPDQHQSTLELAPGGTATTEMPRAFPVTGAVKVGKMAKVNIEGGQVVDATCSGDPDRIVFSPAKANEQSIVLKVTDAGANRQWDTILNSYITGPDGIAAQGTPGGRYMGPLSTFRNDLLCYTVTGPAGGKYVITFSAERTAAEKDFSFDVP